MTLRDIINRKILDYADEKGVVLTDEELRSAIDGVEYCISECMAESVGIAYSNVMYDRENDC